MLNKHIIKNLISKFFGLGVNLINQIALIPLFIKFWGIEKYGDWIIISTIMSFFSMSNVGFNDVIANKFVIAYTEGKKKLCVKYITNNYFLLIFVSIICFVAISIFVAFCDTNILFGTRETSHKELIFVIYFLFFQIITAQFSAVLNAIYRSIKKTYIAFYLEDGAKLFELLIMLTCIYFDSSFILLSMLLVVPKFLVWGYKIYDIPKYFKYNFSIKDFDLQLLKNTAIPSISFMAFPAGYALMNQGFTLLIAKNYTAEVLILYNTTRTLCNFIKTLIGMFQSSVWPEFSIAYGNKDFNRMIELNRKSLFISISVTIIIGIILLIMGPTIYKIWLGEKIIFNYKIMLAFLFCILFGNIWYSTSVVLMSTNKHIRLGIYFLVLNVFSLVIGYSINLFTNNLSFIVLSMLIVDIPLSIYCLRKSLQITHDKIKFI